MWYSTYPNNKRHNSLKPKDFYSILFSSERSDNKGEHLIRYYGLCVATHNTVSIPTKNKVQAIKKQKKENSRNLKSLNIDVLLLERYL